MNVLVAGGSGFLGTALIRALKARGDSVTVLVRREARSESEISWDPGQFQLDAGAIKPFDVIVNLCGRPIVAVRWTAAFRQELYESRIKPTRTIVQALKRTGPKILLNASGIGYFGATRGEICTDNHSRGEGFFAELAEAWEREASQAPGRVVSLRFGVVLGRDGGILRAMRPAFLLGLGGRLGSGNQRMSWISLTDAVRAILFAIDHSSLHGPINAVSPEAVTNSEFTAALAESLHRKAILPVPESVLRTLLGTFAEETMLGDLHAIPRKLLDAGFHFEYPALVPALAHELSSPP